MSMLLDCEENRRIVDAMRSLGILLVICFHVVIGLSTLLEADALHRYVDSMPAALNIAWQALGSEIVFVFSGFLLSYLLLRDIVRYGGIDIGDFWVRRLSRIVPLYLVALMLYALVRDFTLLDLVLNLLFVSKLFGQTTIIPIGWSLEVLVQAYVLLPFVVLLFIRSGHPLVLTIVSITMCLGARFFALFSNPHSYQMHVYEFIFGADAPVTHSQLYYHLGYRAAPFLLGFFLAYLIVHKNQLLRQIFERRWASWSILAASLAMVILSGFLPIHDQNSVLYEVTNDQFWLWFWTLQRFVFAVGICGLTLCFCYWPTRFPFPVAWLLQRKIWTTISRNIYSIYLFHPAFLIPSAVIVFRTWSVEEIGPVYALEIVAIVILVSVFSTIFGKVMTKLVEAPSQRLIRDRFRKVGWRMQV